ncbi:MAG: hypothetical protein L0H59_00150 [Tomitella sp.]|nr:hypothetical protein [Tomitella sp.]
MGEPRYARDMTRVMRHKGKMWNLSDFSLAAIGGVSLQPALIAVVIGGVTGFALTVVLMMLMTVPFGLTFIALFVLTTVAVYVVFSRNRGGKEQPFDQMKMWIGGRTRDPGIVRGARRDDQPHHLRWVAIVWRPEWADVDVTRQPQRRKYNPQPVGDHSFTGAPKKPSTTFEDLLS